MVKDVAIDKLVKVNGHHEDKYNKEKDEYVIRLTCAMCRHTVDDSASLRRPIYDVIEGRQITCPVDTSDA